MNWSRETQGWVGTAIFAAALLAALAWTASMPDRLRQYEVTLGDGTTATCVVVQGVRSAGVTCIPHVVVGEDDAVGYEVKP
jgi:hypothetical protein